MNERFEIVEDVPAAFAREVANSFADAGDSFTLALSGGSAATSCYEALRPVDLDWGRTNIVWGDERLVNLDHEDSNYLLARNALLDWVSPPASVLPMGSDSAEGYDKVVRDLMPIDLVHLGMGPDGHVASLFPGSPALEVADRFVVETGDDLHRHPRMTLTLPAIAACTKVVFTVMGAAKADMLKRVRQGDDLPATKVRAAEVVWLVDPAAAQHL